MESPNTQVRSGRFDLRKFCKSRGVFIFSATVAVSLIALLARWSPIAEITSHFRALYALSAGLAFLLLLMSRSWGWTVAAAVLTLWHTWAIAVWYLPPASAASNGMEIKALTANVNADTDGYARLLEVITSEEPDLVFIQELSPKWAKALEAIHSEYPYRVISARLDYFGLGLYSRYPVENAISNDPVDSDVPISRGDVLVGGSRVHFINAHLAPPEGRELTSLRYQQFAWLTEYLEKQEGPSLVAGDFNCTMWSPLYHDLVRRGRLSNARQGHGVLSSWFTLPGSLNLIPIDHILGGDVYFTSAHLTKRIGSDHTPLVATFRISE